MSSSHETQLGRILAYLVAISTIIGIPAGLYGYFAAQHRDQVQQTFAFYKQLRATPLEEEWSLLIGRWNAKADEASDLIQKDDEKGLSNLVGTLISDDKGSAAFDDLLSFFDEASACVQNSLCDRNASVAILRPPATQLADAFGSYILSVRQKYGNTEYGTGVFRMRALKRSWFDWF